MIMPNIISHASANTLTTGFNGNWTNPENAYSNDNTNYATIVTSTNRNYEWATNFRGFDFSSIPDNATILSVAGHYDLKVSGAWSQGEFRASVWADVTVSAALTAGVTGAIGPNLQYTQSTASWPTSDTYWDFTLTGTLPTVEQLKGTNFGVRCQLAKGNNGTSYTVSLDDVYLDVTYSATYTGYGQAQAKILGDSVKMPAQAQGTIKVTSRVFAQAQTHIRITGRGYAQAASGILSKYQKRVLSDGPAAYWKLDEASGNPQDASGNGNHVTATAGSPTYGVTGAIAVHQYPAVELDGSTNQFTVNHHASIALTTNFTLEAWVYADAGPTGSSRHIINKGEGAGGGYFLSYNHDNDEFRFGSNSGYIFATGPAGDTAWHHVVATVGASGNTAKVYVDGVDKTVAGSNDTLTGNTSPLYLGAANSANWWDGKLDELAIYSSILTPIQVQDHWTIANIGASIRSGQAQAYIEAQQKFTYAQALGQIGVTDNLYTAIDEASYDDTDYLVSPYNSTGYVEIAIPADEPDFKQDHILRVRFIANTNNLDIGLYQGATSIKQFSTSAGGSFATVEIVLSSSEIANITDYSDLRVRFNASSTTARVYVSWVQLQLPPSSGVKTRRGYGQAQAQIFAVTTNTVYGQAQAQVKRTEQGYAQSLGQIRATYQSYGQAQSQIRQTYRGYGQSQAQIRATYAGYGQTLAQIRATYQAFGQAYTRIRATYRSYGQAQALVRVLNNRVYANAQAQIRATYRAYGQSQAIIRTTYRAFANAQGQIRQTYRGYAQALAWIRVTDNRAYGQSQAQVKQTYQSYAQGQAYITVTEVEGGGQAQALIRATYQSYGQTLAQIKSTYQAYGQAFGQIKATYQAYGQAQAQIVSTYQAFGQTLARIRQTYQGYGQAQAQIRQTYRGYGQALAIIKQTYYGFASTQAVIRGVAFANAQATIKATSYVFANAVGYVLGSYLAYAQAQSTIKATSYQFANAKAAILGADQKHGQAQATIRQTYQVFGNTLAQIRQTYQSYGQALSRIRQTYRGFANAQAAIRGSAFAQAQALIRATYRGYGNTQALIRQTYRSFANAQAVIRQTYQGYGQASVIIRATYQGYGQSLGQIKQTYQSYAQAQAQIRQTYAWYGQAMAIVLQTYYGYGQSLAAITATSYQSAQSLAYIYIPQFVRPISDISNDGWEGTVI